MIDYLPTLNALLNATSAVLLVTGRSFIKRGNRDAHKRCMIATFTVSCLFLLSYLSYHAIRGTTHFTGIGWWRDLYMAILGTHTVCAAAIVPLAILTLRRGLAGAFVRHKSIARWTFPVWLYVSVTGVIVYLMLYHLRPAG